MKKIILPIIIIAIVAFFYPDASLNIAYRIRAIISVYSTILLIALLTLGLFISISLYIRYKRKKRQVKYLLKKLRLDKESILKLNQESINKLYKESVAKLRDNKFTLEVGTTSVALFDVLYNLGKIDPFVLSGINHLHHDQNFESMGDLTGYLTENIITSSKGSEAWIDMIHKYKGYTGEEVVFDRIGFENITVPESAVNAGYDFIHNEQKYDIKISSSSEYIQQTRNELPEDVNLWINREHAADFSNDPRIYVDENLSQSHLFELTNNTFNSIDSMSDLINSSIPLATLAISSFRNYKLVKSGSKDKKIAAQDILLDTAGVGIGGMIGSSIGTRLSQYLTPITGPWSFVIIPISTTLGLFIGIITGKGIVNWYKERHIRKAQNELKSSLTEFEKIYRKRYKLIINDKKNKTKTDGNKYIYLKKNNQNIISRYFWPNTFTTFCEIAIKKIFDEFRNFRNYYINLKQEMIKSYKKEERGLFLYSQGRDPFTIDSKLCDIWDTIENKISLLKIEIEKKK